MKRSRVLLLLSLVAILVFLIFQFIVTPDLPVDQLKAKYTYNNSNFIEMDGMEVHYRINGEGSTLILLHGTSSSLHTWEAWTEILSSHFRVISLDLPGFGLTGPFPDGNYSIDHYVRFLDKFVDSLAMGNVSIAGNSLGGLIGWVYTTEYQNKIDKLILVDPAGFPRNKDSDPPLAFKMATNPLLKHVVINITPRSLAARSVRQVYGDPSKVSEELIDRYYELTLREGNRHALVERFNSDFFVDPEAMKSINIPVLIQWGEEDHLIPVSDAYRFDNLLQNSELIIYQGAGHVPMEEIPEETVNDALQFLNKPL